MAHPLNSNADISLSNKNLINVDSSLNEAEDLLKQEENPFDAANERIDYHNDDDHTGSHDQILVKPLVESQLEDVHETIINLGVMAGNIGNELHEQGTLLDELDGRVDDTNNRLSRTMRRIDKVIQ